MTIQQVSNYSFVRLCCHRKLNFTLVEMLVVIAIIGILASLLMPGLRNAISTARMVQCSNNLKQIGIGSLQYLQDNYGKFPDFRNVGGTGVKIWREYYNPYVYPSVSLGSCYENAGPWRCPEKDIVTTGVNRSWVNSARYGGNFSLTHKSISSVKSPGSTMLAIDTNLYNGNHTFPKNWGSTFNWIDWRHLDINSVMLFIDNHIQRYNRYGDYTEADFDRKQWPD